MDADEKLDSVPQLKELGNKLFKVITFLAVASSKNCDGALEHQLIKQLVITVLMQGGGYANKRLENTRQHVVKNTTWVGLNSISQLCALPLKYDAPL